MRDALQLRRLVRMVSEGQRVDWDRESGGSTSRLLEMLRVVQAVGELSRQHAAAGAVAASAAPPPRPAPIGRWGPLELLEHIGSGGFGEVYRAWDPTLEREVALKLRRAERTRATEQLLTEARALARVAHPNVLTIHGADVHDDQVGMWTDLVTGCTLEALIHLIGPLDAQEAALVGQMLCRALAAVHAAKLLHLDVKTSNVMRAYGGRIVLLDFGAAHLRDRGGALSAGTPLTMAPELLFDEPAGPAADLYSLGVLLYRLVTLRYPIDATSIEDLRHAFASGVMTSLRDCRPELPTAFVHIVERALSRDPARRQTGAGAMERALSQVLGGVTPSERIQLPLPPA